MVRCLVAWTAYWLLALGEVIPSAGSFISLAPDNLRTKFREEPNLFAQAWPMPVLMDGRLPKHADTTDLTLYSNSSDTAVFWADYLYPLQWEREFDGHAISIRSRGVWWVSYVAAILYLVGLWAGLSIMEDKQPFDLRRALAFWNLLLAAFSFMGTLRIVPHLVLMWSTYGFTYTQCRAAAASYGSGAAGFWLCLFIFSKYFELLDTVFLVLRKRKVGFLHWYHHCTVLLYCWNAYVWEVPIGIYFVGMNYSIHAVMYFYYFLAAACKNPPKWGLMVTIMQLLQMAVGIVVTVIHLHTLITASVPNCDGHIPNLTAALGMYASYFILFFQFLVQRYFNKRRDLVKPPPCLGVAFKEVTDTKKLK